MKALSSYSIYQFEIIKYYFKRGECSATKRVFKKNDILKTLATIRRDSEEIDQ